MLKTYRKRTARSAMRKHCPVCNKNAMNHCGRIRAGPRKGFRTVYKCKNCGYQSLR